MTRAASIHVLENVIYRRQVRDMSKRHLTMAAVTLSAIATLETL